MLKQDQKIHMHEVFRTCRNHFMAHQSLAQKKEAMIFKENTDEGHLSKKYKNDGNILKIRSLFHLNEFPQLLTIY